MKTIMKTFWFLCIIPKVVFLFTFIYAKYYRVKYNGSRKLLIIVIIISVPLIIIKGYLCYKTIFCNKVAINV